MSDLTLREAERAWVSDPGAYTRWLRERCRSNLHYAKGEDLIIDWIESPPGKMVSFWCYGCNHFIVRHFWEDEDYARRWHEFRGYDWPDTEVMPPGE